MILESVVYTQCQRETDGQTWRQMHERICYSSVTKDMKQLPVNQLPVLNPYM